MYHQIHQLHRQGYSISYIADYLVLNWRTVNKYLNMSEQEYEPFVSSKLKDHPETSSPQIHDWLKEQYPDLPKVSSKTVYNFVMWIRQKHHIPKQSTHRDYRIVEELPYGKQAQVDFGEYTMRSPGGKRKKVYFFTIVLSRSRYKYIYFSEVPFTTSIAITAHEKAFSWFKGIPKEVVYDQDKVFLHDENKGDLVLTKGFRAYVSQRKFELFFCRKADPQSKGKVENLVKYVKQNFLYNRTFFDIDTLNEEALAWLGRTANANTHGKTKQSPLDQWSIEKPYLSTYIPYPQEPETNLYTIRRDNTLSYKSNRYSLPLGTWSFENKKVLVSVEQDTLIINRLEGKELCRHKIGLGKGKTIINNNHKRDHSKSIDQLIDKEATTFTDPEKAKLWFTFIRKEKPRYIRDQIRSIISTCKRHNAQTIEKALEYCLNNAIYNASDFKAIVEKYNPQEGMAQQNHREPPPLDLSHCPMPINDSWK